MNLPMHGSAVVLLFVLLGGAGCATSKPESGTAPGVDVAAYTSFGWESEGGSSAADQPPLSIQDANIFKAIRTQLIEKGYREVEDEPDFLVSYETEIYTTEKVKSPVRIGVGVGGWGGNVGGGVGTSVPVGPEGVVAGREIQITIRAVDPKRNQEVWVGTTTEDIARGLDAGVVEKAVAGTMKKFPARRR